MRSFSPAARVALFLILASGASGCDSLGGPDYEEQVVVSAVLEVGQPLRRLTLSRTVPLGDRTEQAVAVEDARVTISLLAPDGSVEAEYVYEDREGGRYVALDEETTVLPGRRYRLRVEVPGKDVITAETLTPIEFDVVEPPMEEVEYLAGLGPSFRITASSTESRQSVYLFQVEATAIDDYEVFQREDGSYGYRRLFVPGRFGPTTDAESFIEDIDCEPEGDGFDCDAAPADFASGSSPLLNEEAYIQNPDGTITVTVPWLAIRFYGPYTFTLNTFDDALVDFLLTQAIQFNPTTLSPGEIPNVTTNVENGLGVFGSFATTTASATIVPRSGAAL